MGAGFAELLRHHRLAARLTQEALAERSRLSVEAISALERGWRRLPRRETVALLADALRLAPEERAVFVAASRRPGVAADGSPAGRRVPAPPTPLVGRRQELEGGVALLRGDDGRLLTLTGAPGVGKTRLALAVAAELEGHFHDGVFFVDLAPLVDPGLVGSALRHGLGMREAPARPLVDRLAGRLAGRRVLLLLDNFEHLAPAATLLAELMSRCPRLRLLVTSRAALHVRGERELLVAPLPERDAVALFLQRVRATVPGFELRRGDAAAIAEICERLDRLPLALELAAAWIAVLPPRALLTRLENRLPLLVNGAQDLPERQRTMRRTLEWSHDLLGPGERALLGRLSVFSGGADLRAVEAVCLAAGPLEGDLLALLSGLVGFNLVQRAEEDGEPRVTMLGTVQEFARERLQESGEAAVTARAHAAHYIGLAETADRGLTGPEQVTWFARLAHELHNVRASLRWARDHGEAEVGLRLANRVWRLWETHGHSEEGLAWFDLLLAAGPDAGPEVRALALKAAGNLARRLADYPGATDRYEASLAIYRSIGDRHGESAALNNLGNVAWLRGDLEQAVALHEANLALRRSLGGQRGVGVALNNLAIAVRQAGDPHRALGLLQEGLALRRAQGDWQGCAYALVNLGELAVELGDHARAEAWLDECAALCRELGDMQLLAGALGNLGWLARAQGDVPGARARYREGIDILVELGEMRTVPYCLEGMAATAWMEGRPERAAYLYGAAAGCRESTGMPRLPTHRADHDPVERAVRGALGEERHVAAEAAGRRASLEGVLAELLSEGAGDRADQLPRGTARADARRRPSAPERRGSDRPGPS